MKVVLFIKFDLFRFSPAGDNHPFTNYMCVSVFRRITDSSDCSTIICKYLKTEKKRKKEKNIEKEKNKAKIRKIVKKYWVEKEKKEIA